MHQSRAKCNKAESHEPEPSGMRSSVLKSWIKQHLGSCLNPKEQSKSSLSEQENHDSEGLVR